MPQLLSLHSGARALQGEKPPHSEARALDLTVAPAAYSNWRRPTHSNKGPAQPQIELSLRQRKRSPLENIKYFLNHYGHPIVCLIPFAFAF